MKKLILIVLIITTSCSVDVQDTSDPIFCSTEDIAGIEITVRSSDTDEIINDNITVVVTDEMYTETLQNNDNRNVYSGAYEREGEYTIRITSSDYETYMSTNTIIVESDICHVVTERRDINISPN